MAQNHDTVQDPAGLHLTTRAFASALATPFLVSGSALAATVCHPGSLGPFCTSQIDFASFAPRAYQNQEMSQWCWAACFSMLFDCHGHPVSQRRIVSEAYGAPINMPAGTGLVLARQLNRTWRDDRGVTFELRVTAAYDADARVFNMSNAWLVTSWIRTARSLGAGDVAGVYGWRVALCRERTGLVSAPGRRPELAYALSS